MRKEMQVQGQSLVYYRYGQGAKTWLLLPGFAETAEVFKHIVAPLSQHYTVLVAEHPGTAGTQMAQGIKSLADLAHLLVAMLDEEQIAECCFCGHSMGGYIALAMAFASPERCNGLALIHSTAYADDDTKKEARNKGIRFMQSHGHAAFVAETNRKLFHPAFAQNHPDTVDEYLQMGADYFDNETLVHYYKWMRDRPHHLSVLEEARFPVLFVAGDADVAISKEDIISQSIIPEQSYIHILENTGHLSMLECPEKLLPKLMAFAKHL